MKLQSEEYIVRLFGDNPAMLEIWSQAWERIERGEKPSSVQRVVLREWAIRATASRDALELEARYQLLSAEKQAELAAFTDALERIDAAPGLC